MFTWEFNRPDDESAALLLPADAQRALIALLDALIFDPHGYGRGAREPAGKAVRMLPFAGGRGTVTVVILDADLLVVVVQVAWLG